MTPAEISHLYSRATMSVSFAGFQGSLKSNRQQLVQQLFEQSKNYTLLSVDFTGLTSDTKKIDRKKLQGKLQELRLEWTKKLISGNEALRERMTFFWHNHFACRINNPHALLELNNVTRTLAFAPFKELLVAVSKTPAMLSFLNNQVNRKEHPNENFARELLELFTIGRGNYSETDIKEAARAFTGWGFKRDTYEFVFRAEQHDDGIKSFMGKQGNFSGEDIIDIVLEKKETARYLCRKMFGHFVSEAVPEKTVNEYAEFYYSTNYHTGKLIEKLFLSDFFYEKKHFSAIIKSPVELLVGLNKSFPISWSKPESLLYIQRITGQLLFNPPNVAGWPGGKNWIDSSSLMFRLKLPSLLVNNGIIGVEAPHDNDEMPGVNATAEKIQKKVAAKTGARVEWEVVEKIYEGVDKKELATYFVPAGIAEQKLELFAENASLKELIVKIISLPEYQLG
ncbi:MAG TPA: DUF1800 domain-containing protein [Flavobacteriales bacterium]|nr:DUF1800 domain-containing protein [Flavobacteriales bacterium]